MPLVICASINELSDVFIALAAAPPPSSTVSPFLNNGIDTVPLLALSVALATYLGYVRADLTRRVSALRKEMEETRRWEIDLRNQNRLDPKMKEVIECDYKSREDKIKKHKERINQLKIPDALVVLGAILLLIEPLCKGLKAITQNNPPSAPWSFVLGMIVLTIAMAVLTFYHCQEWTKQPSVEKLYRLDE
jgi:hypothetical protein